VKDGCSDQSAITTSWLKNQLGASKLNRMMPPMSNTYRSARQSVLKPTTPWFSRDSLTSADAITVAAAHTRGAGAWWSSNHSRRPRYVIPPPIKCRL
jgi:hypothetical protein